MELKHLLKVLRRWIAVIVGIVVVVSTGIFLNLRSTSNNYSAQVRLQLTAPDRDDVRLVDEYRYVNQREEATLAQNNFTELANGKEVYGQTQSILGLTDEQMAYTIEVEPVHDSDFVMVRFISPVEENLAEIANVHVAETIKHLGNTRALSSESSTSSFSNQLEGSVVNLEQTKAALSAFQAQYGIISLGREIQIEEQVIENLEIEKTRVSLELSQAADGELVTQSSIASLEAQISAIDVQIQEEILNRLVVEQTAVLSEGALPEDLSATERSNLTQIADSISSEAEELKQLRIANLEQQRELLVTQLGTLNASGAENQQILQIETLIAERRANLATLIGLEPEYNILLANANGALETYELVLEKFNESKVRAEVNRGASFVQIVDEAFSTSLEPNSTLQFLVMGIAVSLVLGILVAFLLEYFFPDPPSSEKRVGGTLTEQVENQPA